MIKDYTGSKVKTPTVKLVDGYSSTIKIHSREVEQPTHEINVIGEITACPTHELTYDEKEQVYLLTAGEDIKVPLVQPSPYKKLTDMEYECGIVSTGLEFFVGRDMVVLTGDTRTDEEIEETGYKIKSRMLMEDTYVSGLDILLKVDRERHEDHVIIPKGTILTYLKPLEGKYQQMSTSIYQGGFNNDGRYVQFGK